MLDLPQRPKSRRFHLSDHRFRHERAHRHRQFSGRFPPNKAQSFVIAFSSATTFNPTNVSLGFSCTNAGDAAITPGVNTLLLSVSTVATSDVVALGATTTNDGILHIAGTTSSNAFAVATVDVGAGTAITATANSGSATLPLTLSICQTDPVTAACLSPAASSVNVAIAGNATPTFSIFAGASGAIPFLPGVNRIFVQFSDLFGAVRGSTSVAVETQ